MPPFSKTFSIRASLDRISPFLGFFLALGLVLLLGRSPVVAQTAIKQARIAQVLDSQQVFIQNRQARVNDSASKGQRVSTANARAELVFNTGAIGRLARNSSLTVGQCAYLKRGTLLVNGAMNGCTSSVVAGVRGTTYLLEVDEAGQANVKVLEGEVTVARSPNPIPDESDAMVPAVQPSVAPAKTPTVAPAKAPTTLPMTAPTADTKQLKPSKTLLAQFGLPGLSIPSQPAPQPSPQPTEPPTNTQPPPAQPSANPAPANQKDQVVLKAGEQVAVSPAGSVGVIQPIGQEEFTKLLTGILFNGFPSQLPGISKIQQSFQRLYPSVPFPISVPSVPSVPVPIRLPF